MTIEALTHQSALMNLIQTRTDIDYYALIGGFGAGKSFTDVLLLMYLTQEYRFSQQPVTFGIFGVTIKLLTQTVIADFESMLKQAGIPFKDNSQKGRIEVGNLSFVYLQMQNPGDIFAHNFMGALVDELDELPPEKVLPVVEAVQERTRKMLPAGKTMPARRPFMVFTTTAQGLGGTYQFFERLRQQNRQAVAEGRPKPVPFAIIHARTIDNPYLDPKQVERLRALYTKDEAEAYLEGKFVNLSKGRVWHSYDPRKHKIMPFAVQPTEQIYVGQDFNGGFNASAEMICRGNRIILINSHHWNDMAVGAKRLRELYPTNPIVMIPDASGKEIMQGFAKEYNDAHIELFWNTVNPSITERIMAGNTLFRQDRLVAFSEAVGDHTSLLFNALMALETHDYDEKTGKPRKGAGQEAPDHFSDSFSYGLWRIIYSIQGFNDIVEALRYHREKLSDKEA